MSVAWNIFMAKYICSFLWLTSFALLHHKISLCTASMQHCCPITGFICENDHQ